MKSFRSNRRQFLAGSLGGSFAALRPRPARAAESGAKLRAGAATSNITPHLGCSMAGLMTDRVATEVHDELHVRALALDNGQTRLAIAVADSCAVPREIFDRAKRTISEQASLPISNILLSATHTHTAPPAAHLFQSQPDPKYQDFLALRVADAVLLAVHRLEPARIGWGVGREPRLVFNRRYFMKPGTIPVNPFGGIDRVQMNPRPGSPDIIKAAGPTDPEVGVLAIESLDGRPIAVLGSYALHYVGGERPGELSADYFAVWARSMARLAGLDRGWRFPPFVAMLGNACSGNINGVNFLQPPQKHPPYEQMQRYADVLAAESYRTWREIEFEDSI
jgi:hypothetical protein